MSEREAQAPGVPAGPPALEAGAVPPPVELAPPAAGARGALAALCFYAGHPEAGPSARPVDRVLWGAGHSLAAARLVLTDQALRRAALLPTALTLAGCATLAVAATLLAAPGERDAAGVFHRFLVAFVALASLPPTVLQRLWIGVARAARLALGQPEGEEPHAGRPLLALWWREGLKAVRQTVAAAVSLAPFALVLEVLPLDGVTQPLAAALWAFYWVVVDAFELPMDVVPGPRRGAGPPAFVRLLTAAGERTRLLRPLRWAGRLVGRVAAPWNEELHFTESHCWETLGFALVMGTLLAVPVLGLFFRAVGITAATALLGRLGEGHGT